MNYSRISNCLGLQQMSDNWFVLHCIVILEFQRKMFVIELLFCISERLLLQDCVKIALMVYLIMYKVAGFRKPKGRYTFQVNCFTCFSCQYQVQWIGWGLWFTIIIILIIQSTVKVCSFMIVLIAHTRTCPIQVHDEIWAALSRLHKVSYGIPVS